MSDRGLPRHPHEFTDEEVGFIKTLRLKVPSAKSDEVDAFGGWLRGVLLTLFGVSEETKKAAQEVAEEVGFDLPEFPEPMGNVDDIF